MGTKPIQPPPGWTMCPVCHGIIPKGMNNPHFIKRQHFNFKRTILIPRDDAPWKKKAPRPRGRPPGFNICGAQLRRAPPYGNIRVVAACVEPRDHPHEVHHNERTTQPVLEYRWRDGDTLD